MSAVGACASAGNRATLQSFLRARCELNGTGRDCRLVNLTGQTVFVESFVPLLTGSEVTLSFRLPNGHQVSTRGVVSNYKFQEGFSVDFIGLSADDREAITRHIGQ